MAYIFELRAHIKTIAQNNGKYVKQTTTAHTLDQIQLSN